MLVLKNVFSKSFMRFCTIAEKFPKSCNLKINCSFSAPTFCNFNKHALLWDVLTISDESHGTLSLRAVETVDDDDISGMRVPSPVVKRKRISHVYSLFVLVPAKKIVHSLLLNLFIAFLRGIKVKVDFRVWT